MLETTEQEHYRRWEQGQVYNREYEDWDCKRTEHMDLTFDEYYNLNAKGVK